MLITPLSFMSQFKPLYKRGKGIVIVFFLLLFWQFIIVLTDVPSFILPAPIDVMTALWASKKLLFVHFLVTFFEVLGGLFIGVFLGVWLAVTMQLLQSVRNWLLPVLLVSQTVPVFALAPILVLWLGYGMLSKVVMTTIIIFFPVLMTCFDGLRYTAHGYIDLAQTMNAKHWQTVLRIRLPAALPALASGLRMAVAAAPIGAIIGEWVGSSSGLGYYMLHSNARMQIDNMFAALFVLSIFSIFLYYVTDKLLKRAIPWIAEHQQR